MAGIETARAIYREEAEKEQSATSLAEALRNQAIKMRQLDLEQERQLAVGETRDGIAQVLEDGARDLQAVFSGSNPTMKVLPGNTAGQAYLGVTGSTEIDVNAIESDGPNLIDTEVAKAVSSHESRHEAQRQGDAAGVQVGETFLSAHELHEWDAMEHEIRNVQHSADYEVIRARVSAVLSKVDRDFVVKGRFRDLEAKKAGQDGLAIAA